MPDNPDIPQGTATQKKCRRQVQVDRASLTKKLGPGLITGAADDDPSGIATYSQGGAQFGLQMLWTLLITWPLMVGIQSVSARIGRVTGEGLASNLRRWHGKGLLITVVGLLVIANTINIAADLAAMADVVLLIAGGSPTVWVVIFGTTSVLLQIIIPYVRYVRVLKWLTLSLLAYVGTVFTVQIDWGEVLYSLALPRLQLNARYLTTLVAILGTTISPYLFFWQASQEVEELKANPGARPLRQAPEQARAHLRRIAIDNWLGMGISNLIAFFIMLTTAVTLFRQGITDIQSSRDAALALRPIAGEFAFLLFALGIVGTGLLAIPVLAGSAAYAVAGAFAWPAGLDLRPGPGVRFYGIISVSTLVGAGIGISEIDPLQALYWAAVLNGIVSVPIMIVMMRLASQRRVMGAFVVTRELKWLGWAATAAMASAVVLMLALKIQQ
jgi:NRAMP (natural resistance-associated macrophage protein)-like metal ion transporter